MRVTHGATCSPCGVMLGGEGSVDENWQSICHCQLKELPSQQLAAMVQMTFPFGSGARLVPWSVVFFSWKPLMTNLNVPWNSSDFLLFEEWLSVENTSQKPKKIRPGDD